MDADSDEDDETQNSEPLPKRTIRIGNTVAVRKYFYDACEAMQQLAIKWILKMWIKAIEPKKQSTYPYSDKNRNVRQKGQNGATLTQPPSKGAPPWWPTKVRFKEPDHLKKPGETEIPLISEFSYIC